MNYLALSMKNPQWKSILQAILSSLIEKLQQIRDQHFYSLNLQEYLNNIEEDTDDA